MAAPATPSPIRSPARWAGPASNITRRPTKAPGRPCSTCSTRCSERLVEGLLEKRHHLGVEVGVEGGAVEAGARDADLRRELAQPVAARRQEVEMVGIV